MKWVFIPPPSLYSKDQFLVNMEMLLFCMQICQFIGKYKSPDRIHKFNIHQNFCNCVNVICVHLVCLYNLSLYISVLGDSVQRNSIYFILAFTFFFNQRKIFPGQVSYCLLQLLRTYLSPRQSFVSLSHSHYHRQERNGFVVLCCKLGGGIFKILYTFQRPARGIESQYFTSSPATTIAVVVLGQQRWRDSLKMGLRQRSRLVAVSG